MKRILSCLTVLALLFTLIVPCFAAGENSSVIYIKTAKNLIELSEKCTLDTWSQSKTVLLDPIDFLHATFSKDEQAYNQFIYSMYKFRAYDRQQTRKRKMAESVNKSDN